MGTLSRGGAIDLDSLYSDVLNKVYPVGSIYISVNSTNPKDIFGGAWEQLKDRFLLGCGSKTNGATGGEEFHILTVDEMPSHQHALYFGWGAGNTGSSWARTDQNSPGNSWTPTQATGGSQGHNTMPPYLAVYMWKRVS